MSMELNPSQMREDTIEDVDKNTRVMTEKNPNENKIRFYTNASERMIIDDSGNVGIGTDNPANTLEVAGDIKATGNINAKQRDIKFSKYTSSSLNQRFIRFNSTGSTNNTQASYNSVLIAPVDGELLSLKIRVKSASGSTDIAFHKASDGVSLPISNWAVTETVTIDIASPHTTYTANFSNSSFTAGQVLGVSINPTTATDDVNITTVWLLDWNS